MKRTIKVLSIIAVVMVSLAIFATLLALTVFWKPLMIYVGWTQEVLREGPVLTSTTVFSLMSSLAVPLLVCFGMRSNRTIAVEIIAISLLIAVLPAATQLLSILDARAINQAGTYKMMALSLTNQILNYTTKPIAIASALCYISCGMSIADKVHMKMYR